MGHHSSASSLECSVVPIIEYNSALDNEYTSESTLAVRYPVNDVDHKSNYNKHNASTYASSFAMLGKNTTQWYSVSTISAVSASLPGTTTITMTVAPRTPTSMR
ncbi:hypothetical protein AMS68_003111 [Peltaster fructicola]|uniref:Uncharacterized protein n=1 Tax=Peltaster fructicola TaxID=286661 RepID=A0A6H0XS83_9PEZI|nr:hypothetical protein AMS68_003111 [Peltaster fructicola]